MTAVAMRVVDEARKAAHSQFSYYYQVMARSGQVASRSESKTASKNEAKRKTPERRAVSK